MIHCQLRNKAYENDFPDARIPHGDKAKGNVTVRTWTVTPPAFLFLTFSLQWRVKTTTIFISYFITVDSHESSISNACLKNPKHLVDTYINTILLATDYNNKSGILAIYTRLVTRLFVELKLKLSRNVYITTLSLVSCFAALRHLIAKYNGEYVCHVKKVCCGKEKKQGGWGGRERERNRSHMGTSKQAGVEFQRCGKQQTLQSVQEGNLSRWGACELWQQGCVPPGLTGRTVGGLTPQSNRKRGWSSKRKQTQPALLNLWEL